MANKALDMAKSLRGEADGKLQKTMAGIGIANAELAISSAKKTGELKIELEKNNKILKQMVENATKVSGEERKQAQKNIAKMTDKIEKNQLDTQSYQKKVLKQQTDIETRRVTATEKRAAAEIAIQRSQNSIFKNFAMDMKAQLKLSKDAQAERDKNKYSTSDDTNNMSSTIGDDTKKVSMGLFGKLAFWAAVIGTQMSDFAAKVMTGVKVGLKAFNVFKIGGKVLKPIMGFFKSVGKFASGIGGAIGKITGVVGKLFGGVGKLAGKGVGKTMLKVGGKLGLSALKKIPGIGALIGIALGVQRFSKGQTVKGAMEIASGLASIVPGFGTAASMIIDAALIADDMGAFKDMSIMGMLGMGGEKKPQIKATKKETVAAQKTKTGIDSSFSNYGVKQTSTYTPFSENTDKESEGNTDKIYNGQSAIKLQDGNEDINGLTPGTNKKLKEMSVDYKSATGNDLQVNSAYRSLDEQAHLFKTLPKGKAAAPGSSMHNFGIALDIPSAQVNQLAQNGLLQKYGFNRPIPKEGWHIEDGDYNRWDLKKKGKHIKEKYLATGELPANTHFAAQGAVLNRPVVAGEAGPEAIIPLNDRGINVISEAMNKHMNITGAASNVKDNSLAAMSGMKQFLSSTFIPMLANEMTKAMQLTSNNNSQSQSIVALG